MNNKIECVLCTAFRKNHEPGAAALLNSLVRSKFQGKVLLGVYNTGPAWLDEQTLSVFAESGLFLQPYKLKTSDHPSHVKPKLLQAAFQENKTAKFGFFFDADIVVRAPIEFFLDWVAQGIALVGHENKFPPTHPHRLMWLRDGKRIGLEPKRSMDEYINGGFIGIRREDGKFLDVWRKIIDSFETFGLRQDAFQAMPSHHRWLMTDQSALNLAVMVTENPVSIISGDGMDFLRQGFVMSHAAGKRKPWEPGWIRRALRGMPPNKADHNWLNFLFGPGKPYSEYELKKISWEFKIASLIGRFYRNENWSYYPPS